ncbi:nitrate- and nitrite sensing domain-containing protein [Streptomyces sp. NPDC058992]|uniref:sensor histidine kinase n=1 Tax=Streptomyces sp. NPDC058992 TaxID=3346688 RepID=UPI0036755204
MIALLIPPVLSLMVLVALASVTSARHFSDVARLREVDATLLVPLHGVVTAAQAERTAASRYMTAPTAGNMRLFSTQVNRTNSMIDALREAAGARRTETAALSKHLSPRIEALLEESKKLPTLRGLIHNRAAGWHRVFSDYSEIIEHASAVDHALADVQDAVVFPDARGLALLSLVKEMVTREDAVAVAVQASGRFTVEQHRVFLAAAHTRQALVASRAVHLRPEAEAAYENAVTSTSHRAMRSVERDVEAVHAGAGAARAVSTAKWKSAESFLQHLGEVEAKVGLPQRSDPDHFGLDLIDTSGIAIAVGLAGVLLSLLASMRIGRGLVADLVDLRSATLDLARHRLPRDLDRIEAGMQVTIISEVPPESRSNDTIGQVRAAVDTLHRAVLVGAVERAKLRAGMERAAMLSEISGVYVKLARRSQVLLHRQLSLLDEMERRVDDPALLEDLFRLDHLTNRMRRHAESLIILSGALPARGWRRSVPFLDVVRAAVSEVEDYPRVEVRAIPEVRLKGPAVADITHLIAELAENAVTFSPPQTRVIVRGERVGKGLALEVEDRGLGMGDDAMAEANRRIRQTEINLRETRQIGLFVVNRLSRRHDVTVTLQRSPYHGVLAIILVPEALLDAASSYQEMSERDEPPLKGRPIQLLDPHREGDPAAPSPAPLGPPQVRRSAPVGDSSAADRRTGAGEAPQLPSGLPRRVRRPNTARQWGKAPERERTPIPQDPTAPATSQRPVSARPSPDDARAVMHAMRTGWLRGRNATTDHSTAENPSPGEES